MKDNDSFYRIKIVFEVDDKTETSWAIKKCEEVILYPKGNVDHNYEPFEYFMLFEISAKRAQISSFDIESSNYYDDYYPEFKILELELL